MGLPEPDRVAVDDWTDDEWLRVVTTFPPEASQDTVEIAVAEWRKVREVSCGRFDPHPPHAIDDHARCPGRLGFWGAHHPDGWLGDTTE